MGQCGDAFIISTGTSPLQGLTTLLIKAMGFIHRLYIPPFQGFSRRSGFVFLKI
jgi:hypothetical protein